MRIYQLATGALAAMVCSLALTNVNANEIYLPPVNLVTPAPIDKVPDPRQVPGKQYTDSRDLTHTTTGHSSRPSQLGHWDGRGGARDGQLLGAPGTEFAEYQVDAQSEVQDKLFRAVTNNAAPLIVSVEGDGMLGNDTSLAAELTSGVVQTFATRRQIVDHPHADGLLRDIDSVDLWGQESEQGHAGFFSFKGEPNRVSIYSNTLGGTAGLTPYITQSQIAMEIGADNFEQLIDVDGLMVRDIGSGLNPFDGTFNKGDAILFSIEPITSASGGVIYDGGEIWLWEHGSPAVFLNHGGHVWDTAFDVAAAFGINTQNIDALEAAGAVPEPGTLALLLSGAMAWISIRRRRNG